MGFMAKITGFTITYAQWIAAGMPRRDPEWIKEIFETKCRPCPYYNPLRKNEFGRVGVCSICSCHVSADPEDNLNKIVLPNTSCPDNPPKWSAVIDEKEPK